MADNFPFILFRMGSTRTKSRVDFNIHIAKLHGHLRVKRLSLNGSGNMDHNIITGRLW